MATITIQQGQSLGQIAKDNNTTIDNLMQLNPQIKNANLIYAGQQITLPFNNTSSKTLLNPVDTFSNLNNGFIGPVKPATTQPGQIDLSVVSQTPIPEVQDNTYTEQLKLSEPAFQMQTEQTNTNNATELSDIDNLLNQKNTLQAQVDELESKINNRNKTREDALTTAGVYDDIKALSDLKSKQQALEEESRLYLVGKAGTKAGLASLTNLESRQALLQEQQLQNRVNTNLDIIDQKLKADNEAIDTLYTQKIGLLNDVSKNYADLLTAKEQQALEDSKFQQQVYLENLKANNNLILERGKSAIEAAAKNGVALSDADLQAITSGNADVINKVYGNNVSLDASKGATKVDLITSILNNKDGLASSVGVNALGRTRLGSTIGSALAYSGATALAGSVIPVLGTVGGAIAGFAGGLIGEGIQVKGDVNRFSADLGQFVSQEALDYYVSVKSKGATFGALTDKEQTWLQNASQAGGLGILIKTDKNGNKTYESNLSEESFKEAMENIRSATQKVIIGEQLRAQGKDTSFLKGLDNNTLNNLYIQTKNQEQVSEDAYSNFIGNKTSLNIPQRNNNPGNVKTTGTRTGGVAAQYALRNPDGTPKVDKYNHLIFPTPEAGLRGLVADLTAKINGQSSYMPANPSLAQLGSVYAEDGSWASGVARILGVPVGTATSTIPMTSLVAAISKQEGYFS